MRSNVGRDGEGHLERFYRFPELHGGQHSLIDAVSFMQLRNPVTSEALTTQSLVLSLQAVEI